MPLPSNKDGHLYAAPRTKKTVSSKDIPTSSSLTFSSALSSLISAASTTPSSNTSASASTSRGRPRPTKPDIFTSHNRNSKKRAVSDLLAQEPSHTQSEQLDDVAWKRTKRKMEEKARLYAAMKRGDVEDDQEKHMVDFDRKWVEKQETRASASESDDEEDSGEDLEVVEYTDEFGRQRKGTRGDAAREERRRKLAESGRDDADRFTARPVVPTNLIFGDTIQSNAFRPDDTTFTAMEELASKRDKSLTPPPEAHYDANWEVRTRGTGFFQFSADAEERQKQMENLEKERQETERTRGTEGKEASEVEQRKVERQKQMDERRRVIEAKRGKLKANKFLDELGAEMGGETGTPSL